MLKQKNSDVALAPIPTLMDDEDGSADPLGPRQNKR